MLNRQNNLEKEQCWKKHASWLQTILQSYSLQNHMVLAQKQTYRSIEQNRKPRNKFICFTIIWFVTKETRIYTQWKKYSLFNKWCWENWTVTYQKKKKKEIGALSYITHKKWTQNGFSFKCEAWNHKISGRKTRRKFLGIGLNHYFFFFDTESTGNTSENPQVWPHQTW